MSIYNLNSPLLCFFSYWHTFEGHHAMLISSLSLSPLASLASGPSSRTCYEAPSLRSSSSILAPVRLQFLGVISSVLGLCCRLLSPPPCSLWSLFLLPQAPSCSRTSGQIWCVFLLKAIWNPGVFPLLAIPQNSGHRWYSYFIGFVAIVQEGFLEIPQFTECVIT